MASGQLPKDLPLVPFPSSVEMMGYDFPINEECVIIHLGEQLDAAQLLQKGIEERTGILLPLERGPSPALMEKRGIFLNTRFAKGVSEEWYQLLVSENLYVITGQTDKGVHHGIQTFLQLVPQKSGEFKLPALKIEDSPKFKHRGMLLDCSRHFFEVDVVKKYIDLLAYYKMNILHWHLTEDQGWRIEIKKYPKLTDIGAWRTQQDGRKYGGYYTQEQIKEVVRYAAERHITIIPEIEMPGHSLAALASYPHLACTDGPFEVTNEWGVFKDVYCAGDDTTFHFLENVLTEVIALFPSKYIHIGGDESPKYRWENCEKCQKRIKDEHLHDEHELQSYFISRIQKFLQANGREIIGWDEIIEGGLVQEATVQSWRGMEGAYKAAKQGNEAIVSPTSHCYLDYSLSSIDLKKIYSFDPYPKGLNLDEKEHIIGGECNMWTEHVPDERTLDWKILPRMIGMAEVLWTYPDTRNVVWLRERLQSHYRWMEGKGINYGFETIPIGFNTSAASGRLQVIPEFKLDDVQAHYTLNGRDPGISKPTIEGPIDIEKNAVMRVLVTQNGRAFPEIFELPLSVHKGLGRPVYCKEAFSEWYTAGGYDGLTDGILGTFDFRDGHWQGYQGTDVTIDVDLGTTTDIAQVGAHFYVYNNAWIFPPASMTVSFSADGSIYSNPIILSSKSEIRDRTQKIENIRSDTEVNARHVRFELENMGPCPEWHDAAGSPSWIFIDELIIK